MALITLSEKKFYRTRKLSYASDVIQHLAKSLDKYLISERNRSTVSFSLGSSFSTQNPCINLEHNKLKYLDGTIFVAYTTAFLCYLISCPRLIKDMVF